ncbi:MAG TPA: hypothetical protein DD417_19835 [Elusimicrobia bacterium]|nr:hypothetical protein [Elusimicrobiota bacterium]
MKSDSRAAARPESWERPMLRTPEDRAPRAVRAWIGAAAATGPPSLKRAVIPLAERTATGASIGAGVKAGTERAAADRGPVSGERVGLMGAPRPRGESWTMGAVAGAERTTWVKAAAAPGLAEKKASEKANSALNVFMPIL